MTTPLWLQTLQNSADKETRTFADLLIASDNSKNRRPNQPNPHDSTKGFMLSSQ